MSSRREDSYDAFETEGACSDGQDRIYANGGANVCGDDEDGGSDRCPPTSTPDPGDEGSAEDGASGQVGGGGGAGDDGYINGGVGSCLCTLPDESMAGAVGANGSGSHGRRRGRIGTAGREPVKTVASAPRGGPAPRRRGAVVLEGGA